MVAPVTMGVIYEVVDNGGIECVLSRTSGFIFFHFLLFYFCFICLRLCFLFFFKSLFIILVFYRILSFIVCCPLPVFFLLFVLVFGIFCFLSFMFFALVLSVFTPLFSLHFLSYTLSLSSPPSLTS